MIIRAVVFDLDGTLYPSWQMAFSSIHLLLFHPRLLHAFARARKDIRCLRPIEDFRKTQARLVAEKLGIPEGEAGDLIERKMYRAWKSSFRFIRPFPGCAEAIRELRNRRFKTAVMSDFPVEKKLVFLGLENLWDLVCTSETTGYLKPNQEPFLALAADLHLPPEEILYVGNSYSYDILGAHQTGMWTAHFTPRSPKGSLADISFCRFSRLPELVDRLVLETDRGREKPTASS